MAGANRTVSATPPINEILWAASGLLQDQKDRFIKYNGSHVYTEDGVRFDFIDPLVFESNVLVSRIKHISEFQLP